MTDPIIAAARFLQAHLDWLRHRSATEIQECFADIAAAARVVRSIVMHESPKYLGPCGARREHGDGCVPLLCGDGYDELAGVVECECWCHDDDLKPTCDGDVYGRPGAATGTCRTCGATVNQEQRRIWLDEQVRSADLVWTATNIADALSINVKTVRSWATERRAPNDVVLRHAKLGTFWRDGDHLVPWTRPRPGEDVKARGDRLHYVADVIALARAAADERERRAAAREAAEMGA